MCYPDDRDGFVWHHRLLVTPSGRNDGRWAGAIPDYDIAVRDLVSTDTIPLNRAAALPFDDIDGAAGPGPARLSLVVSCFFLWPCGRRSSAVAAGRPLQCRSEIPPARRRLPTDRLGRTAVLGDDKLSRQRE